MLRYALRRILWAIPTLIATSLVLFFVTTLAPSPSSGADPFVDEGRRARFSDLPRFFNPRPDDVRTRAERAVAAVAAGGAAGERAERHLRWLGGAAFPYVLPRLETLEPAARGRLAEALVPVAERMGVTHDADLTDPATAAVFFIRFWDDRALDFTRPAVERSVDRLVTRGSDLREADLVAVGSYALPEIVGAMAQTPDPVALSRLTHLAQVATGRGDALPPGAPREQARRVVASWRDWWFVHETDFRALDGASRGVAMITETRYGKWVKRAAAGELGVSVIDGEPISSKLAARAPITAAVCGLAMLLGWSLAVPLGALAAWWRGGRFDAAVSGSLFVLYATPTFGLALLLRRLASDQAPAAVRAALAVAALSAASLASLSRWQRAAMLEVIGQDYVRTARAKGVGSWRLAVVHVLRNALLPNVTLAGLQLPALLGGAMVVEVVFGLHGVGLETLRAVEAHDASWLMGVVLASAVTVTAGLVASDVAYGALDPRVREVLTRRVAGGRRG